MKSYVFRLEGALHWREAQVNLQKSKVAGVAGELAGIRASLDRQRAELSSARDYSAGQVTGSSLQAYADFAAKSLASISAGEARALVVQRNLTLEMKLLVEANQKARLLENLKKKEQFQWHREFDRELATFADEAFLRKLQLNKQRAGA